MIDSIDMSTIAGYINTYGSRPAQFTYNQKVFVSTFIGDGFDWRSVESQSKPLFACPNWQTISLNSTSVDCGFSWDAVCTSSVNVCYTDGDRSLLSGRP